jgi:hypothetical protein
MNTRIYATFNDSFDIGCRVIKWDESDGFNFIPNKRYTKRDISYEDLQSVITQFTLHWSVTYKAKHCFSGLKARGLSANFILNDDDINGYATIYQCLPISYAGWSQGSSKGKSFNSLGPGVEISYMPQRYDADMYDAGDQRKWDVPPHDETIAPIHGTKLRVHIPTESQMNSLYQLIWGFSELFPDIPAKFPRNNDGTFNYTVLKKPHDYIGLVNHYNLRRGKIDAAGLDLAAIEHEVSLRKKFGY